MRKCTIGENHRDMGDGKEKCKKEITVLPRTYYLPPSLGEMAE